MLFKKFNHTVRITLRTLKVRGISVCLIFSTVVIMQARTNTKHKNTRARVHVSLWFSKSTLSPKVDYVVDLSSENPCHIENLYGSRSVHISHLFEA